MAIKRVVKPKIERELWEDLGGEDEGCGRKAAQEIMKVRDRGIKEVEGKELDYLDGRGNYVGKLAQAFYRRLRIIEWPWGYGFKIEVGAKGLGVRVKTPGGQYSAGIAPAHDVRVDVFALGELARQIENLIEYQVNLRKDTLWLPKNIERE